MQADEILQEKDKSIQNTPEDIKDASAELSQQSLEEQITDISSELPVSCDVTSVASPKEHNTANSGSPQLTTQQSADSVPTQSPHVDGNLEESKTKSDDKPARKKLSSSGRKRFRFLLRQGYAREEARQMALLRMNAQVHRKDVSPSDRASKISKTSEGSDVSGPSTQIYKIPPPLPSTLRAREKTIKVGILSKFYPDVLLTPDRLRSIQSDILEKVVRQAERDLKPKFNNIAFRDGYLEVGCADSTTAKWLRELVPNMKPWHSATLVAVDENNLPQPDLVEGFFPTSLGDPSDKILSYIAAQNEGLDSSKWKIVSRTIDKSTVRLSFTVDLKSAQNLKAIGYKINYKFSHLQLIFKGNQGKFKR